MNKKLEDMFIDVDLDKIPAEEETTPITLDGEPPATVEDEPVADEDKVTKKEDEPSPSDDVIDEPKWDEEEKPSEDKDKSPEDTVESPKDEDDKSPEEEDGKSPEDWTDTDVLKILEEIVSSTEEAEEAAKKTDKSADDLKKKVEGSWDEELKKQLEEYEKNLSEERIARQKLQTSNETLQAEYDKLLQDKLVADAQGQKAEKIQEVINQDPELQAIVAYAYKSGDDETYKEKLVSAAKEYLRKVWDIDVDELLSIKGSEAKSALWWDPWTEISSPSKSDSIYGMFE